MNSNFDWQQLYAANQAAIKAALGGGDDHDVPDSVGPATLTLPKPRIRLPRPTVPRPARRATAKPGGSGRWQALELEAAGGRSCFVYTPPDLDPATSVPLVVVLHGCTQSAAEIARVTGMNQLADSQSFAVAYPQQSSRHNGQACWNWFQADHQARGGGEPAVIAGMAREVAAGRAGQRVDAGAVYVCGLSAGGAMAAILGATYPDVFRAIGVHSGLAFGSATSQERAFEAMARGGRDPKACGRAAFDAMGDGARPVPTIVVHGTADHVVSSANGEQVVEQWLTTNRLAGSDGRPADVVPGQVQGGHPFTRRRWHDRDGQLLQEQVAVKGMGHAWSGGAAGAAWSDPKGPDASRAMWEFFAAVTV